MLSREIFSMRNLLIPITVCSITMGCGDAPRTSTTSTASSETDAQVFYREYEVALKGHRRDALADFYHPNGTLLVINGTRMRNTRAGIDSTYRGQWQGPAFFAFDSLHFEALDAERVLVTGRFRWLSTQSPDTGYYAYLSILDRTPAGLKISVEHETQLPGPPQP
jgi:hypothetical protein